MTVKSDVQSVVLAARYPKKKSKKPKHLLSTGSTLINLAYSGNPNGGILPGKYYLLVGDSASGKTFMSVTCFAEVLQNPYFKHYRLIYDNVEDGCLIDVANLFSQRVEERIEAPAYDEDHLPLHSETIEDFYYNLDDAAQLAIRKKQPFIYVLDSMDSLTSEAEADKFQESKQAHRKGKTVSGSYGDGKAKKNSTNLRAVLNKIRKTGSILIILSQTRDNIGFGFDPKTRSGGNALRFYATVEAWTSIVGSIKKTVNGKPREVGIFSKLQVKKNRISGQRHTVVVPIYPSYGMDDIGSCVDYLIAEKWWRGGSNGAKILAKEFGVKLKRNALIRHIEQNDLQHKLAIITGECWSEVQDQCALKRKRKYEE